jgi:hypothetical protein
MHSPVYTAKTSLRFAWSALRVAEKIYHPVTGVS